MKMGKPVTRQERAFGNVQMTPKSQSNDKINANEKERLVNRITGYKPKNKLYVDGEKHNKMGKDEFLRLLSVQLNNQDPMNPMEQNKMAAELAQFSQLEQLTNLNTKFDGLNKDAAVKEQFYGASFLGKQVVTSGNTLKYEGEGKDANILFNLPKKAEKVLVRVFDNKNNMVGEVWQENIGRGNQNFSWDGQMLDGQEARKGEYKVSVFAWDETSEPITVNTKNRGNVESVFFEGGETVLMVDGKKVFLRDVDSFHMPKNQPVNQMPTNANTAFGQEVKRKPQVNAGMNMQSTIPSQRNVESNKNKAADLAKRQTALNVLDSYKKNNAPSTGMTSVYDIE